MNEPQRETGNVDTWKLRIITRPARKHLPVQLVFKKAMDRRQDLTRFLEQLQQRTMLLRTDPAVRKEFLAEMRSFLPPAVFGENLETDEFWSYLVGLITDVGEKVQREALWKPYQQLQSSWKNKKWRCFSRYIQIANKYIFNNNK